MPAMQARRCPGLAVCLLIAAGCSRERLEIETLALPPVEATSQSADAGLIALLGTDTLLLGWMGGDGTGPWSLFVARSPDGGRSWSAPVRIAGGAAAPGEARPSGESSPRLVAGPDGQVAIAWAGMVRVEGRKWPATRMRLARSQDGGASWTSPMTLNDDSTGAPMSHQFHGAAWQGDSGLVVAWLDERHAEETIAAAGGAPIGGEPDATIYAASSPDFGRSWTPNQRLWGAACPCCRVTLARGAGGRISAAWRQHFPGSVRDVVTAPASAGAEPVRVHADEWAYPGCPHTGPAAAADSSGALHAAWYSGKDGASGVYYRRVGGAHGSGPLVTLFRAEHVPTAHPAVTALRDGGALVAYDAGPEDRAIRLGWIAADGRLLAQGTVPGSSGGTYPQLAPLTGGRVAVAYTVADGGSRTIKAAVVRPLTAR
jgi:hypothetical protein